VARGRETTLLTEDPMASDIQVYGTDWCGLTNGVRRYLTAGRFEYDYFNIDDDHTAEAFVLAANHGLRLPIVVIAGRVVTNPTAAELRHILDEHGIAFEPRSGVHQAAG
jgi:glutaredoxin